MGQLGKGSRSPIDFADILALGRSLWRQGLLSNYRQEYWKFFAQSLSHHRHHFSKAITLAIMGHHFFQLTQATEAE